MTNPTIPELPAADGGTPAGDDALAGLGLWARLLLQRYLAVFERGSRLVPDGAAGLGPDLLRWLQAQGPPPDRLLRVQALDAELARVRTTARRGPRSPFGARQRRLFGCAGGVPLIEDLLALLVAFDVFPAVSNAVRLLSLWPEASGLERGFLQTVLDPLGAAPDAVAELLREGHPLNRRGVVRGLAAHDPARARFVDLEPALLTWLIEGVQAACSRRTGLTAWLPDDDETAALAAIAPLSPSDLQSLRERLEGRGTLRLSGLPPLDVRYAVRIAAQDIGLPVVGIDLSGLRPERGQEGNPRLGERAVELLRVACVLAWIEDAPLLVQGIDGAGAGSPWLEPGPIAEVLGAFDLRVVLDDEAPPDVPGVAAAIGARQHAAVHVLAFPDRPARRAFWLRAGGPVLSGDDVDLLSGYPMSCGQILETTRELAEAPAARRTREAWVDRCRRQVGHRVGDLAQRVVSLARWQDVILPPKVIETIREMVAFVRNRERVFGAWGFGRRTSYGTGLSALFAGPPGTGKTMVAGIIANELGLDLYKIDLSRIVSKYIGETEQRLARLFDEAARGGVALLFDEADSLFARRTDVKSSVDRYANLEVNFLLQKMEEFEGVAILTSNFAESIDEAFKRRIRFRIDFPKPDEKSREQLWQVMMSADAPTEGVISYRALARAYEFTGGEIRNAVLRAAFYAAESGRPITLLTLDRAAGAEARERGRLVLRTAESYR